MTKEDILKIENSYHVDDYNEFWFYMIDVENRYNFTDDKDPSKFKLFLYLKSDDGGVYVPIKNMKQAKSLWKSLTGKVLTTDNK